MNTWMKSAFLLLAALSSMPVLASAPNDTLIRSAEQLAARLRDPAPSPLDALSPGARERLPASLSFSERGLSGLNPTDFRMDLEPAQCRAALAMFLEDPDEYADAVCSAGPRERAAAAQRKAGISEVERHYNRFYLRSMEIKPSNDIDRARAIAAAHAEEMPALDAARLRAASDGDLHLLLRAALEAASGSSDSTLGETAQYIFAEYERRGPVAPAEVAHVFNLLLAAHRFDDAARFATQHPDAGLPPLPEFDQDLRVDAPSVWEYDGDSKLVRRAVGLDPVQIIVTAGCHFSADAAEDISADPVLGPVFQHHARWLSDAPGREDMAALGEWNRKFPKAQMTPIYERSEWAMFPVWRMPVFHIVRNGKIIESVSGWPRNPAENREPLIAALKRAGLLPP